MISRRCLEQAYKVQQCIVAIETVVANKDLSVNSLDWKKVTRVNSATDWTFVPVGGQHRNGISESTVKVMKKSPALALSPCFSCIC